MQEYISCKTGSEGDVDVKIVILCGNALFPGIVALCDAIVACVKCGWLREGSKGPVPMS